jgi:long-chain fatty acid transport protein
MRKTMAVMNGYHLLAFIWGLSMALVAGPVLAGGLYLQEFGTSTMGTANAGAQAWADDASTVFHNPAGMTRIKGNAVSLGFGMVVSNAKFDPDSTTPIPGTDGGNAGGPAPLLGSYYVHSLSDRLKLGVGMTSISGAVLNYDNDWTGRYLVRDVSIFTMAVTPNVAYRITDWFSLGAGFVVTYGRLNMTVAVPPPDGTGQVTLDGLDDFTWAFRVGALFELSPRTRVGIGYQSRTNLDFSGNIEFARVPIQPAVNTEFPFPQLAGLGIYHELNDKFALLASGGWEQWSDLGTQFVSTARGSVAIPRNWDDTWKIAGGIHYRPTKPLLLQAGISYDTSPVSSEDRTPDVPIDRQIRYAVGAQYQWSERLGLGLAFEYADYGSAEIENELLLGDYSSNDIFFTTMTVNISF